MSAGAVMQRVARCRVLVLLACAGVCGPAFSLDVIDLRVTKDILGDAAAGRDKAATCAACHGANGIAMVPLYPNLAGQPAAYLYWQLVAYKRTARADSVMTPMVATLEDADMRDLAAYYASLPADVAPATPPAPAQPEVIARGESLFLQGDPTRGIPPCAGCHGADARGVGAAYPHWPHLRGQQAMYLSVKLQKYHDGQEIDSTQDRIMQGVAQSLASEDIAALSAYLAGLVPAPASP